MTPSEVVTFQPRSISNHETGSVIVPPFKPLSDRLHRGLPESAFVLWGSLIEAAEGAVAESFPPPLRIPVFGPFDRRLALLGDDHTRKFSDHEAWS